METDIWRGSLLPLNEIEDKLGDLWSLHEDTARWRFIALDVVPESQCDLDNEASNPLEQDDNNGNLGDDTGITDTPDFGLTKNTEIGLCGGIGSLGGRPDGFQLLIPVCAPDDLGKETREFLDGYMLGKPVIIDPVRAICCIPDESRIL